MSNSYRMPAEWAPHAATLVAWPHETEDWPGKFAPIPWVYAEIVRRLAESERVLLLVEPGATKRVTALLKKTSCDLKQVTMLEVPTDRVWMRDSGPTGLFDANGQRVLLDWQFNAWAKYDNWTRDDLVPAAVAAHLGKLEYSQLHSDTKDGGCLGLRYSEGPVRGLEQDAGPSEYLRPGHPVQGFKDELGIARTHQPMLGDRRVVLEGGGIEVNGAGLLITTEEWLLSEVQVRNPGFGRADYEQVFAEQLGITNTIWLGRGIAGDDTHGHVDDITRFVAERTVVTAIEDDSADPNFEPLRENRERLRRFRDTQGGLEVIDLPMPEPVMFRRQRLPASYANFYIANSVVLVPTFNDPKDRVALGILAEAFPGREVIGIHAVDLVWGLGTLHCLTQQIPQATTADAISGTPGSR